MPPIPAQSFLMTLVSNVTAALSAIARPHKISAEGVEGHALVRKDALREQRELFSDSLVQG